MLQLLTPTGGHRWALNQSMEVLRGYEHALQLAPKSYTRAVHHSLQASSMYLTFSSHGLLNHSVNCSCETSGVTVMQCGKITTVPTRQFSEHLP